MITERRSPTEHFELEGQWLGNYVEGGMFPQIYLQLLKDVYDEIISDPEAYKEDLEKFLVTVLGGGVARDKVGPNVKIVPKIYIARLLVGKTSDLRGAGVNIVFSPNSDPQPDAGYPQVGKLYKEQIERRGINEHTLPFGVFWADAYYYRGNCYLKGERDSDDDGFGVFEPWEQTWNYIEQGLPAFFLLGAPFIPDFLKR